MENIMGFFGLDDEDLNEDINYFANEKIKEEIVEETEEDTSEDYIEEETEEKEETIEVTIEETIEEKVEDAEEERTEEPISEATELLKAELDKDYKTSISAKPIIQYLISKCGDEDFADRIKLEGKTVQRCLNYISKEIKGKRKGVIEDQVLFGLAVDYYLIEDRVFVSESAKLLQDKIYDEHDRNLPAIPIIEYLINKCEEDEVFAERVALKEKRFVDCGKYVLQEVKKVIDGSSGYLEDQIVYDMAVDYYVLDGELIEKPKVTQRPTPKTKTSPNKTSTPKVEPVVAKPKPQLSLFEF